MDNRYCIDCKKLLTSHGKALRCRSCASRKIIKDTIIKKGHSLNWKGGLPKCGKCGKLLARYDAKLCKKCRRKPKPICLECGKVLVNRYAKYCKSHSQKEDRSHNWQGGLTSIIHYCIKCNKKISRNSWFYGSKLCNSCSNKGKNNPAFGKMSGEQNPNWAGGKSFEEYGIGFDNHLKEQVRCRDKYKCQVCGCSQLENYRQLDVHHKDYNKKNNIISNLISLCHKCHLKTNYNRPYWTQYFNNIAKSENVQFICGKDVL
jgi:hypothetical protein